MATQQGVIRTGTNGHGAHGPVTLFDDAVETTRDPVEYAIVGNTRAGLIGIAGMNAKRQAAMIVQGEGAVHGVETLDLFLDVTRDILDRDRPGEDQAAIEAFRRAMANSAATDVKRTSELVNQAVGEIAVQSVMPTAEQRAAIKAAEDRRE